MTAKKKSKSALGGQKGKPRGFRGGRPPGTPNKSTQEVKDLIAANVDFEKLVQSLAKRAMKGNLKAAKILFEYRFGRPAQQLTIKTDEPIQLVKVQVVKSE